MPSHETAERPVFPLTTSLHPESDPSLSDRAISEVKRSIIGLELVGGESFTEGALATRLGMSKSPVREALSTLRRQGWLDVIPRSGYQVRPMTIGDAQDLFSLRALLEPEAARLAADNSRRDPAEIAKLRDGAPAVAPVTGRRTAPTADQVERELVANYRFHRRIAVIGANRELDRCLAEVLLKIQRYLTLSLQIDPRTTPHHDHHDLVDAVHDGDPARAAEVAAAHVERSRQFVLACLLQSSAIRDANLSLGGPGTATELRGEA